MLACVYEINMHIVLYMLMFSVARDKVLNIWDIKKQAVQATIPLFEVRAAIVLVYAFPAFIFYIERLPLLLLLL